jgi:xylan 1,4-beta-xylosidase
MKLYNSSAHAIKAVDSSILVGGPATAGLADVPEFVAACKQMNIPFDFVR